MTWQCKRHLQLWWTKKLLYWRISGSEKAEIALLQRAWRKMIQKNFLWFLCK